LNLDLNFYPDFAPARAGAGASDGVADWCRAVIEIAMVSASPVLFIFNYAGQQRPSVHASLISHLALRPDKVLLLHQPRPDPSTDMHE